MNAGRYSCDVTYQASRAFKKAWPDLKVKISAKNW